MLTRNLQMITPTKTFPLLTRTEVEQIESKLDVQLPDDYKNFLLTVNAENIKTSYFKGIESDLYFGYFLYQQLDLKYCMTTLNLNFAIAHKDESPILGKEYIWFACDHGGEPIYISVQEENVGAIYFLRSDCTFEEGAQKLANSFTHFLDILKEFENHESPEN